MNHLNGSAETHQAKAPVVLPKPRNEVMEKPQIEEIKTEQIKEEKDSALEKDSSLSTGLPRITVFGVGGGGGNAIANMIERGLTGVRFVACNTDGQALERIASHNRIKLGESITEGLGAGSRPEVGRAAAEEALDEIVAEIERAHMVVITAGMGGGTGTGAASVIARAAKDLGVLTVGVVTKPFNFEGLHRMKTAESGLLELQKSVDTLIVIPNQNLFRIADANTTFADAFRLADNVLYSGIRGVTDLIVNPGIINLDFADIRVIMSEMGKAIMGTGEATGENRAIMAAEEAISNPLLDDVSMKGARGVLINVTGGEDVTLFEIDTAVSRIRDEVDPEANIIFGSAVDTNLNGAIRITVVATGIDSDLSKSEAPADTPSASQMAPAPQVRDAGGMSARKDPVMPSAMPTPAPSTQPQSAPAPAPTMSDIDEEESSGGFFGGIFGRKSKRPSANPAAAPVASRSTQPSDLNTIRGGSSRHARPVDDWSRPYYGSGDPAPGKPHVRRG